MRIAVMGTGGVGGYFGAKLASFGNDVTFIARGAHLEAIRERGLEVRSPLGNVHLRQVRVTDDPLGVGRVDLVLFGVKLWDTERAAVAARNMIGRRERFDAVPFFWSKHYDVSILYLGHTEKWDEVQIDGRVEAKDCRVNYRKASRTVAVATIGRDLECLHAELEWERRSI